MYHAPVSTALFIRPQVNLATDSKKSMSLERFWERGEDPMMRQQKTLRLPTQGK